MCSRPPSVLVNLSKQPDPATLCRMIGGLVPDVAGDNQFFDTPMVSRD